MKNLSLAMNKSSLAIAVQACVYSLPISYWLSARTYRGPAGYKYFIGYFIFFHPLVMYKMSRVGVPRRIHTDIICDEGHVVKYIKLTFYIQFL